MKIIWFSWKDISHPQAGGAENVSWQIMQRLVKDGHQVRLVTARYGGSSNKQMVDGVEIFRTGDRFSVYLRAMFLFKRHMASWPDLLVDEMNTIPFGVGFYSRKKRLLLTYQLARKVWFYQMPFPISLIGYALEPFYLFLLSLRYRVVLTESDSTRQDLAKYGFNKKNIKTFRVGINIKPLQLLEQKKNLNKVLVLGAIRPMKRTLSAVKGFELARDQNPSLTLTLAGDNTGRYGSKVANYIARSRHGDAVQMLGKVSAEERLTLMRQAALVVVTSTKEGWGLVVTEANSQGTPAIAYNVDGLRDSIKDQETGMLVSSGDAAALGKAINEIVENKVQYRTLRKAAWLNSQQYTFDNSYADFIAVVRRLV